MTGFQSTKNAHRVLTHINSLDAVGFALFVGKFAHDMAETYAYEDYSSLVSGWWRHLEEIAEWAAENELEISKSFTVVETCPVCFMETDLFSEELEHNYDCSER